MWTSCPVKNVEVAMRLLEPIQLRGTRLLDKGTCVDRIRQDLICLHEIVEGVERVLEMDLGTGSTANISLISGTFSLKLWQLPIESTRFHNIMSTRAQRFCLDTSFKPWTCLSDGDLVATLFYRVSHNYGDRNKQTYLTHSNIF
ncbi:hypothetical protein Y032_0005g2408 [Ancylostoma ceylanicum]|uniref:Uncharacterized protein n=1 Tax=Ancylostoma ceylanicum TaxID=53326 RepID=A0A016VSQ0_9BILA|nr:hypothetical protein Y032_0005g2408 [Ancylostoma ceylanicum]